MKLGDLFRAVSDAERDARSARGLPRAHLLDFAEFPFAFATSTVRQFETVIKGAYEQNPGLWMERVEAALAVKDYDAANRFMETADPSDPKSSMRFGLPIEDVQAVLPEVHGEYPKEPSLFLSCDEKYFRKYGIPLLASVNTNSRHTPIHLHLIDADVDHIAPVLKRSPLRVTITHENSGGRGSDYYNAVRFIRFAETLERSRQPILISDVDGLVMGDASQIFKIPTAAMRVRAGRLEPWNQFSACLVLGNLQSLPYFKAVANIIKASISSPWWGLDQYALFAAWLSTKPDLHLFGPEIASVSDAPGLFWFIGGQQKKDLRAANTNYAQAFRRFAAMA